MKELITLNVETLLIVICVACVLSALLSAYWMAGYWKRKVDSLKETHKEEIIQKNYQIRELRNGTPTEPMGIASMVLPPEGSHTHPNHPRYGVGKVRTR